MLFTSKMKHQLSLSKQHTNWEYGFMWCLTWHGLIKLYFWIYCSFAPLPICCHCYYRHPLASCLSILCCLQCCMCVLFTLHHSFVHCSYVMLVRFGGGGAALICSCSRQWVVPYGCPSSLLCCSQVNKDLWVLDTRYIPWIGLLKHAHMYVPSCMRIHRYVECMYVKLRNTAVLTKYVPCLGSFELFGVSLYCTILYDLLFV